MATKPLFLLTGSVIVDIKRQAPSTYERGKLVPGAITVVPTKCNIQPLKPYETMMMPESDRTRDWHVIFSAELLQKEQEGEGGWGPDEFEWKGYNYKIMKVESYFMGVLDHYRCLAARTPVTAS